MKCPNISHPSWKELVNKVGVDNAYLYYFENNEEIPNVENIKPELSGNEVSSTLLSFFNSDKGVNLFKTYNSNPENFFNKLAENIGESYTEVLKSEMLENGLNNIKEIKSLILKKSSFVGTTINEENDSNIIHNPNTDTIASFISIDEGSNRNITEIKKETKEYSDIINDKFINDIIVEDSINKGYDTININNQETRLKDYSFNFIRELDEVTSNQNDLNQAVKNFLTNNGISYEAVSEIVDPRTGEKLSAIAMADMVNMAVQVIEGKASLDTLPEEAAHFFVEMLGENHPLYQSMFNEVEQYEVYQQVVEEYGDLPSYKDNPTKLKKEAMAKIIAQKLIGERVEPIDKHENRLQRWYNKVINFLKDKVGGLLGLKELGQSIVSTNPFSEAADRIYKGQVFRDFENDTYENEYYLQTDPQKEIVARLNDKYSIAKDSDGYLVNVDGQQHRVRNRVTDRVKAWMDRVFNSKDRTEAQKLMDEIKASNGTKGHEDIENIIKRAVAMRDGTLAPARVNNLPIEMYEKLEKYFFDFVNDFPADTVILTEVQVYNKEQDEAGTIDFIAVDADGVASIFDWKFMDFGKEKKIKWYKEQAFNIQLPAYKAILKKEYGIKKFDKVRVIPIEANYKNKKLTSIKIGNLDIENNQEGEEYLNPLPIFEEMTGDAGLDSILKRLLRDKDKLEKAKPKVGSSQSERDLFFANRATELERIQKSIRDIQLKHDLSEYIRMGNQLTSKINKADFAELEDADILELINEKLTFYGEELINVLSSSLGDKLKDFSDELSSLSANSQVLKGKLTEELKRRALSRDGNILAPQKPSSFWSRSLRTLSEQSDPIMASFNKLIQRSNEKLRKNFNDLSSKVEEAINSLEKQGVKSYDFMLDTATNGRLRVTAKYSKEFYKKLNENRSIAANTALPDNERATAKKWLVENLDFNSKLYEERFKEFSKKMLHLQKTGVYSDFEVESRLIEFKNKYSNNVRGLSNEKNPYVKIKEKSDNFSEKYKTISNNKAMLDFYNLWMETSNKYQDYIGIERGSNFVWNIPMNLVESLAQSGFSGIVNFKSYAEHFEAKEYGEIGQTDPETGKPVLRIPIAFSTENRSYNKLTGEWTYDSTNQSKDLGNVILLVAGMAENHKNMSEIESDANVLLHLLKSRETIATNPSGNLLVDKVTNELSKFVNSTDEVGQLQGYIEHYIYGKKYSHGDKTFKVGDKNYSGLAMYKAASNLLTAKALSFNPISIIANAVGGKLNTLMLGAGNRFFRTRDYITALSEIRKNPKKFKGLVDYFEIIDGDNINFKAKEKSIHKFSKHLNHETLFIGQKAGDAGTKWGILVAMAKKYKVENGKIVRIGEKEDSPSLYDSIKIVNNEIKFEGVDNDAELEKFRNITLSVINSILGTGNANDIRLASRSVMGQMLLTFRSWMPRTFDTRYSELRKNHTLEVWEMGRYRSFFNEIFKPNFLTTLQQVVTGFGTFGIGNDVRNTTVEHAKVLYAEAVAKNPILEITEQEYIELHMSNLRASMIELYLMIAMMSLIMLAAPDDDEKQSDLSGGRRLAIRLLDRFNMELLTFINPEEFNKLVKNPIPLTRWYSDVTNLTSTVFKEGLEEVTGDESLTKTNDLRKYSFRVIPLLSGLESMLQYIEEDYDNADDARTNVRNQ